jgi:SAM-dependent methyltransferase
MLDYGCGVLRTGRYAIPYLTDGKYVGVDIADARIDKGRGLLAEDGVAPETYEAFVVSSCELRELDGYSFDFIWAESVLTHMPWPSARSPLTALPPRRRCVARRDRKSRSSVHTAPPAFIFRHRAMTKSARPAPPGAPMSNAACSPLSIPGRARTTSRSAIGSTTISARRN